MPNATLSRTPARTTRKNNPRTTTRTVPLRLVPLATYVANQKEPRVTSRGSVVTGRYSRSKAAIVARAASEGALTMRQYSDLLVALHV